MGKLESIAAALLGSLREAGIPAALTGGIAANAWVEKNEVRPTYDVDVAIAIPDGAVFSADAIASAIASRTGTGCFHGSDFELPKAKIIRLVMTPDGTQVDLVIAETSYAAAAQERTGTVELEGARHAILAPEDVVLYKGLARRDKDRIAIGAIARAQKLDRSYIEKWARKLGIWRFVANSLGK